MVFGWLKKKIAASPNMVVTGPGVLKTHDVEAKFRSEETGRPQYHGKLKQARWSDGQERFSLRLRELRPDHDGKLLLYLNDVLVSDFPVSDTQFEFRWKGMSSEEIPQFVIGAKVKIVAGSSTLHAIVEPD